MKLMIRPLEKEDIPEAIEVEQAAWPEPWPKEYVFTEEHLYSQISVFQEGLLAGFVKGKIVGFVTTEIVDSEFIERVTTWDQMTDRGFIYSTHNQNGDTMYGVNLSVHPRYARMGVAEKLLYAEGRLAIRKSLRRIVLGGRLPRFSRYSSKMSAEEYIRFSHPKTGKPLDPELYVYMKAGLRIIKVLPNYILDPESMDYGVLLEWRNPFYKITKRIKPLGVLLSKLAQF